MEEQDQDWQVQGGSPLRTVKTMQLKYKVIFTLHFKDLREKRLCAYWVFFLGAQQHKSGASVQRRDQF